MKNQNLSMGKKLFALFIILFLAIGGISFIIAGFNELFNAFTLSAEGKQTMGTVTDYEYVKKQGADKITFLHRHTLRYDGYTHPFTLDRAYKKGTRFPIIYMPDNPGNVMIGRDRDSLLELLDNNDTILPIIALLLMGLICTGMALVLFALACNHKNQKPDES